jgi:hypothetical protein
MGYTTVDVYVDLKDFDDQELIDELEDRGWFVGEEKGWEPNEELTDDEIEYIVSLLIHAMPGTFAYEIYEKLRKR